MESVQLTVCQEKVCFHKLRNCRAECFQQYGLNMKIFSDINKGVPHRKSGTIISGQSSQSPARRWRMTVNNLVIFMVSYTHCRSRHRELIRKNLPTEKILNSSQNHYTISTTHIRNSKARNWNLEAAESPQFNIWNADTAWISEISVWERGSNQPTWIRSAG